MKLLIFDIQRFENISNNTDNRIVTGTADADSIFASGNNVTINALGSNDTIFGTGKNAKIFAGTGNDYIFYDPYTGSLEGIVLCGENGNDTIMSYAQNSATLSGGEGDDSLFSNAVYSGISTFIYDSGNDTIKGFGETVIFDAQYKGFNLDGNDIVIDADKGSVRITGPGDNLIKFADVDGNLMANFYHAIKERGYFRLDGRNFSGFEIIIGADNYSEYIFAGRYGSSLYGGAGGNDDLYGNVGSDEFVYKYGDGNDDFYNIGGEDVVNIKNTTWEQIASAEITEGGIIAKFNDGGGLTIHGQAGTFVVSGQRFGADYQSKTFYEK